MKIITNAIATPNEVYNSVGGLVMETQRFSPDHQMKYWQQANLNRTLSVKTDEIEFDREIEAALYIGRIPMHLGHFLIEGLPRLCDVINMDLPIIGTITPGWLPKGVKRMKRSAVEWIINTVKRGEFYEIEKDQYYRVKTLFVSKLPYELSHHCAEPWRMRPLIKIIVDAARSKSGRVNEIENYYLSRYETEKTGDFTYSNPKGSIWTQITNVSLAKNLYGVIGSNTHLAIFANAKAKTNWVWREPETYKDGVRNQLICDMVKTFNVDWI